MPGCAWAIVERGAARMVRFLICWSEKYQTQNAASRSEPEKTMAMITSRG